MRQIVMIAIFGTLAMVGCKSAEPAPACPGTYKEMKGEGTCSCGPGAGHGTVWGTGIYTADSSVCAAAVHAGAIGTGKAGDVSVKAAAGCNAYSGSSANGITSSGWGSFQSSFYFAGFGDGACPKS